MDVFLGPPEDGWKTLSVGVPSNALKQDSESQMFLFSSLLIIPQFQDLPNNF